MFKCEHEYDVMLQKGIKLSGEDKQYFIRGRLQDLCRILPEGYQPEGILDFGCGLGDTAKFLAELFPHADILGVDTSDRALAQAQRNYGSARISFGNLGGSRLGGVDLCYTNGVFHHILPEERLGVIMQIFRKLRPGGYFAFFENNPWNPGTRLVMKRIPFDRDARPLSAREAKRLLRQGGFSVFHPTRYLFYFPRYLASLRFLEFSLTHLPLGAQYFILAQKV